MFPNCPGFVSRYWTGATTHHEAILFAIANAVVSVASILIARIAIEHRQSLLSELSRRVDYAKTRVVRQFAFGQREVVSGREVFCGLLLSQYCGYRRPGVSEAHP